MAGHMIAAYLKEQGHKVIGFARSESLICDVIKGDALDAQSVKDAISIVDFDVCINCIGILNKAVDENLSEGIFLNSVLPHLISEEVAKCGKRFIHISTDCVFEGLKGGYSEKDLPDASSLYGRSKALGEVTDNNSLTIRTSIIGPELRDGIGLFHWFMKQSGKVFGYKKVIWSGVTTLQLAKSINDISKLDMGGLLHLVNNETISKYDLLQLFNEYCRENKVIVDTDTETISDKSLVNSRKKDYVLDASYEEMILEMAGWIKNHKSLYKQYEGI